MLACAALLAAGCATSPLNQARRQFYSGHLDAGAVTLANAPREKTDEVLLLMERGMVHQARGDYEASIRDWLEADRIAERLDYYSLSRGSTSFVINDDVLAFRGVPFERALLHAFTAKSFMARNLWESAAVEARKAIAVLESHEGYPDSAYSRYLAAFCLEMMGDAQGAAHGYRLADALLPALSVDPGTGRLSPVESEHAPARADAELVCFVLIGHTPTAQRFTLGAPRWGPAPYANLYADGRLLGRSYTLSTTGRLRAETEKVLATRRKAKAAIRVALKETAAQVVSSEDQLLGDLLRLVLFALETPNERGWQTLPQWLQVARVPCPAGLTEFEIAFVDSNGRALERRTVTTPLTRQGNVYAAFVRAY